MKALRRNTETPIEREARIRKSEERRKRNIEIRVKQVLRDPVAAYANWIIKTIAAHQQLTVEQIKGRSRETPILEARWYAVKIIYDNTYFREYSVVFFGRERTTYYNVREEIEGVLKHPWNKNIFEVLKSKCSISEFNRLNGK